VRLLRHARSSTPPGSPHQSPGLSRSWSPVKCPSRLLHIQKIREPGGRCGESTPRRFSGGRRIACDKEAPQSRGHKTAQGVISLRTVAVETPKSLATRAGLNPARTAARTMLAFAGGTSGSGAASRMILAGSGCLGSVTGTGIGLLVAETGPIPRRRASPSAARIRTIRSSSPSWLTSCTRSGR
jgi:hypothetical protein